MSDNGSELRSINWTQALPFVRLFQTVRLALDFKRLVLALAAVLLVYLGGTALDSVWKRAGGGAAVTMLDDRRQSEVEAYATLPYDDFVVWKQLASDERQRERGPFRALMRFQAQCFAGAVEGVVGGHWGAGNGPLDPQPSLGGSVRAFAGSLVWLVTQRPWFALFFLGYALLVLGYFGGAICRSVAVQSAREESVSIGEALRFARDKYIGFLTAPLMPLAIFAVIFVIMWVGGAIGALPRIGEIFAGLVFPLTILGGFAMAMILLALVLGFHLMWPTIAVEGSDGFDALSRACSYVGSRLWHVVFYTFALLLYGGFAFVVVRYIATLTLKCTHWAAGWGMNMGSNVALEGVGKLNGIWRMPAWSDLSVIPQATGTPFWGTFHNAPLNWSEWFAYCFIALFVFLVVSVVAAFVLSFFFCGSTQMYFLLRREVDATDWNEVYYEEPAPEFTPSAPSAAPAATGSAGVAAAPPLSQPAAAPSESPPAA